MIIFISTPLFSQEIEGDIARLVYSQPYDSVKKAIPEMSKKHAIYSYIIANASTPGLDLMGLLPPEDRAALDKIIVDGAENQDRIILEYVMSLMTMNSKRLSVATSVWSGKARSLKSLITLGKQ